MPLRGARCGLRVLLYMRKTISISVKRPQKHATNALRQTNRGSPAQWKSRQPNSRTAVDSAACQTYGRPGSVGCSPGMFDSVGSVRCLELASAGASSSGLSAHASGSGADPAALDIIGTTESRRRHGIGASTSPPALGRRFSYFENIGETLAIFWPKIDGRRPNTEFTVSTALTSRSTAAGHCRQRHRRVSCQRSKHRNSTVATSGGSAARSSPGCGLVLSSPQ